MKVIITGSAGFIGSNTADLFLRNGHTVIGIDNFDSSLYPRKLKEENIAGAITNPLFTFIEGDILDKDLYAKLPHDADCVIHLAAKAGVRPSIQNPSAYAETNIRGTLNILEWMKQNQIRKMVFASSSSIYGNSIKIPFSESDNTDNPISPYAATKKACELINYTYHHLHAMDIVNLRFFTVFGPRQRPDLAIRKFIDLIAEDKPVVLFGNGDTARDYTFIDDIADGIYKAFQYTMSGNNIYEIVNLGNNNPVKLIDMVNSIYEIMGKTPNIRYEPMQPGDVDMTYADIEKAKRILKYTPSIAFKAGLMRYIQWKDLNV